MKDKPTPIAGSDVGDQRRLRPVVPPRSIDEFVAFLAQLEELFGPVEDVRAPTTGKHFEL